ncbi:uncharacterized protein BXZ73DRAFT_106119 [Epithele typhae]|uniref:uncharacterized protein n=1 Tax=Epithele typhae TaxID=378194 RepID=UPI002008E244|nr:uncharacterized protein BXZ73DRAFT_106119 [Epithele typhae]KAH9915570.1 hypothetical protein BXZ73DRAFT_106119 [Epithele typhae]
MSTGSPHLLGSNLFHPSANPAAPSTRSLTPSTGRVSGVSFYFHNLFATFPTLEHLGLTSGGAPVALLHALTPPSSSPSAGDSGPCHALRNLSCFFKSAPEDAKAVFQTLIECLRARARHGMRPLRQVAMHGQVIPSDGDAEEGEGVRLDAGPYLAEARGLVEGEVELTTQVKY